MNKTRWLIFVVLVALVSSMLPLAFTGTAQAGENKSGLAELTNNADAVIEGTVLERSSYWNDEHNRIYTSVVISADEKLKGTVGQQRISIVLSGGEVNGIGQWVSDMPAFDQGERAVVFLKKLPQAQLPKASKMPSAAEQFEVYGGFRGKVAIKQGKIGNLPEDKFKERLSKVIKGQSLPEGELDVPSSPATFPYSYSGLSWPHATIPTVTYRINENTADCTGEGAVVQTAAATWNAAGARFSFSYAGSTVATTYAKDGVNEILWRNFGTGGTIAHAIIWYDDYNNITENDIEFNEYYAWSTAASCPADRMDVETIALHELGHWLCLNDLYDAGDADKVMYGYGWLGKTNRALHSDDIAGIRFIYGAGDKLIGMDDATLVTNSSPNYFVLDKFTAVATGNLAQFKLKCGASGNVKTALYADNAGQPGDLIAANNTSTAVTVGWNTISFPSTTITAGTTYWLAFNSDVLCVGWVSSAGLTVAYRVESYAGFSFPASAGTGFSNNYITPLIAGWGNTVSP